MTNMSFRALPKSAAWQHREARAGFEAVYFHSAGGGHRIEGCTTAIEAGQIWIVDYVIMVDETWTTQRAQITGQSPLGTRQTRLDADGGGWLIDGESAPHLDGCLDVDLESSALTNALPVHRIGLDIGASATTPAAYVRALDLTVERLEQDYTRTTDDSHNQRYDYRAPAFDFACRLVYDTSGLLLDYPGIAARVG